MCFPWRREPRGLAFRGAFGSPWRPLGKSPGGEGPGRVGTSLGRLPPPPRCPAHSCLLLLALWPAQGLEGRGGLTWGTAKRARAGGGSKRKCVYGPRFFFFFPSFVTLPLGTLALEDDGGEGHEGWTEGRKGEGKAQEGIKQRGSVDLGLD